MVHSTISFFLFAHLIREESIPYLYPKARPKEPPHWLDWGHTLAVQVEQ